MVEIQYKRNIKKLKTYFSDVLNHQLKYEYL